VLGSTARDHTVRVLTTFLIAAALAGQPAPVTDCGITTLYGKPLTVRVHGPDLTCEQAQAIVAKRGCRDRRRWSCFSFRPPDPVLAWFKSSERFAPHWTTYVEAVRPPCEESVVTRAAWRAAKRGARDPFPTRLQVLADDLMRCDQLAGMTRREVRALLGRGQAYTERGKRHFMWDVGDERDSFFQVDGEVFDIRFGRDGVVEHVEMWQS
jgi:hypothetical protein